MKLEDKVAIITGSSRGIGKALALDFAREGAKVVVAARSQSPGQLPGTIQETEKEIRKFGGQALSIRCDVSNDADVQAMIQKTIREYGRIDVLINNAAIGYYRTITETPIKHWDLVMKVNLRGPFLCIKAVLPFMVEQKRGSIINISSYAADEIYSRIQRGEEKHLVGCAYGASKAALERLSVGLAHEVKDYNIRVNVLKPLLPTFSEGVAFWNRDVDESELISPHLYMTKAALFLASQEATGITGDVFYDKELCERYHL